MESSTHHPYDLPPEYWPQRLRHIPDPPKSLFIRGTLPHPDHSYICIIGSRTSSPYGHDVCVRLIRGLRGLPITVVSGLAVGIDTTAHTTALDMGLCTIALPGSGLNDSVIYPHSNRPLAQRILESGGALISEYSHRTISRPWIFPRRNRLMAGMCDLVIVIECGMSSGSLITARLALEYNTLVGAVPGSVFSAQSLGPHHLIRQGALVIQSSTDILDALSIQATEIPVQENIFDSTIESLNPNERGLIQLLQYPQSRDALITRLGWSASTLHIVLATLEIKGLIEESAGTIRLRSAHIDQSG